MRHSELENYISNAPLGELLALRNQVTQAAETLTMQSVESLAREAAKQRGLSLSNFKDYLLLNPPVVREVFAPLLEMGITLDEVRNHLVLDTAMASPDYIF